METVENILGQADSIVWGPFLLIPLLLLTGLYLTVMLRGLQVRKFGLAFNLALIKRKEEGDAEGDVSHYQALSTALAATVGVGNIAGVATAITLGGPGAVLWMWVTGMVGMATKYSEAFLGVRYRRADAKGEQSGGPMFYLRHGVGGRLGWFLGGAFAIFGAIAAFGIGNGVQAGEVANALNAQWSVPVWVSGLVVAILAGVVILGGVKVISRVTAGFVPVMIAVYMVGALIILAINVNELPAAFATIFTDAFSGTAAVGGFAGAGVVAAVQYGVGRGIFSNESGLGTAAIIAAAAKTTHPVRQALVSMTQTFIDTLIVVSGTALVIVTSGVWRRGEEDGSALTAAAFNDALPGGGVIVTISVMTFAFSTLLGWGYYGERCMDYLFGRGAVVPYRIIFVIFIFVATVVSLDVLWTFASVLNGLMALPNLVGLLLLSPLIVRETKQYFEDQSGGVQTDPGTPVAR